MIYVGFAVIGVFSALLLFAGVLGAWAGIQINGKLDKAAVFFALLGAYGLYLCTVYSPFSIIVKTTS